ncbi:four-carbon acid sugar kinase family protein [Comamonadaceae bacterium G21597-S1]|nr:four-carbon acid sugar kinase family protein [Comamonadaceae bacterium G21597-S1]
MAMRYAWYGDDFTGACDTLATLAAAGARTLLFLRAPTRRQVAAAGPLDALGIAGTARALAPDAMAAELAPVARCFATPAPAITHYKCCSTFDSAPRVGNLVLGTTALRRPEHDPVMAVFGGQPSLGRFCAFGDLFASAMAGGEVHRIDRHPTMSRHPVTPMHEADLRRHLHTLGLPAVRLIDLQVLDAARPGPDGLQPAVELALAGQPQALLFDTTTATHLQQLGQWLWSRAARRPQLVLGASSVAQAALAHWPDALPATPDAPPVAAAQAPVFLLVGSQSPVTAAQVRLAHDLFEQITIDPVTLVADGQALTALACRCAELLKQGRPVMARTRTPAADGPPALRVAQACARLLVEVLARSPQVRRVGVAGGDTASMALRALDAWALAWQGQLGPGVPLTRIHSDRPALGGLELMLKGGQMGPPGLFRQLLHGVP